MEGVNFNPFSKRPTIAYKNDLERDYRFLAAGLSEMDLGMLIQGKRKFLFEQP